MKYKYLLFDWDGTLHNSLPVWVEAIDITLKTTYKLTVDRTLIVNRLVVGLTENIHEFLDVDPDLFKEQVLATSEIRNIHAAELHEAIMEHLTALKALNVPKALVSSSNREIIDASLNHHNLYDYFDAIVTGNDVANRKPHPEPVLLALSKLKAKPGQTLIVGDSAADIVAGRAAGVKTAIHYPAAHKLYYDYATIKAMKPDYIIHDFAELLDLV